MRTVEDACPYEIQKRSPEELLLEDYLVRRHVIIMNRGVCEIPIARINAYLRPLCLCACIVHVRKSGTIMERIIADACNAVGDNDARKAVAIIERIKVDACYTVGDHDASKAGAIIERRRADACHAVGDGYTNYTLATIERIRLNAIYTIRNR